MFKLSSCCILSKGLSELLHLAAGCVNLRGEASVALQTPWVQVPVDGRETPLRLHCLLGTCDLQWLGVPPWSQRSGVDLELEVRVGDAEEARGLLSASHASDHLLPAQVEARVRPLQLLGLLPGSLVVEVLHLYLLLVE